MDSSNATFIGIDHGGDIMIDDGKLEQQYCSISLLVCGRSLGSLI